METIDIQIKSNAPEVTKETTSLRQQVKELRKEMESCAVGSDEYNDALVRLAKTTHDLKEQQEMVKNSSGDLGTVFSNLQGIGTGIASGFSSVNAIMALTGSNSEALQQTFVKLQAGMALVQGLKGLEGMGKKFKGLITSVTSMISTTKAQTAANEALATSENAVTGATNTASVAMKGFRAALISTGIGAIVVALGLLIANLDKVGKWLGIVKETTNEYKDANENLNKKFEEQNEHLNNEIKLMTASGASQQEIIKEKKRLIEAQKAETLATLNNAKARLQSLKADSAWTRFWHGENKIIKELEEETIPALETTFKGLEKQAESLSYDYKAAELKDQKDLENKRKQAAQKAIEEAKKLAAERQKALEETKKSAEKSFDDIFKSYQQTIKNMKTVRDAVNLNPLSDVNTASQSLNDVEAWIAIYGTDPKKMSNDLLGVANALMTNLTQELTKKRDELIKQAAGDTEAIDKITEAYAKELDKVTELFDTFGEADLMPAVKVAKDDATEAAQAISATFTEQFNALNALYNDGIIQYGEFYDVLTNIRTKYKKSTEKFENEYITYYKAQRDIELTTAESFYEEGIYNLEEYEAEKERIVKTYDARIAELQYQYQIKPLSLQKEVGDKFLAELDKQNKKLETNSARFWDIYNISLMQQLQKAAESWDLYSAGTFKQRYESAQYELDFQKTVYDQEYQAKVEHINNLLSLNTLTVEQEAALRDQLEQLNREKLQNDIDYYTESAANRDEYYAGLQEAVTQGIEAFGDLTNNLARVFTAAAEEMKNADGSYTEEGKKMLETSAALQIATATMTAAAGIATVWATSAQLGPIAGPIVAAIQTAAHIANLVVQIMSIKKALAQGLSGSTSGSGTSAVEPPDTSFTLQSADAYQTTLSDETQTDLQANAKNNQRVYVVSSDITDSQNENKTTVTTATF